VRYLHARSSSLHGAFQTHLDQQKKISALQGGKSAALFAASAEAIRVTAGWDGAVCSDCSHSYATTAFIATAVRASIA
jgi:hypothetical protein